MRDLHRILVDYTRAYMDRHNELCDTFEKFGEAVPLYSDPVVMASVMECKDGIVIVYANRGNCKSCWTEAWHLSV